MIDRERRRLIKGALGLSAGLMLPGTRMLSQILGDHRLVEVRHSTWVMGQIANVTLFVADREVGVRAVTEIFNEFRRLDRSLSLYDPGSDVSRVNRSAGQDSVPTGEDLRVILRSVLEMSYEVEGSLEITIEPLMRLWGFRGAIRTLPPNDREIRAALDLVGRQNIVFEREAVGLSKIGCAIDLGGVAVGYALDQAAGIARSAGIERGLIELSGDFYAIGAPPEDDGWLIGLEDPRVAYGVWATPRIRDEGLSTSGNYNNVVVYNAHRYGHVIDPSRGLPSGHHLSTTVIAPTAFQADALSTALFVMREKSLGDSSIRVMHLERP